MENQIMKLPLIPLRGLSIFPHMALNFDIGRKKSIEAINRAMDEDQKIFIISQREATTENPTEKDIYNVGCVCTIKQFMKLPGNHLRVLVEGEYRAKLVKYLDEDDCISAEVEAVEELDIEDKTESEGYKNSLNDMFINYLELAGEEFKDLIVELEAEEDNSVYCDVISAFLPVKADVKQELLEITSIK